MHLGDLNALVGNDVVTWKGVIDQHGDSKRNGNGRLLLQLCYSVESSYLACLQHASKKH